MASSTVEPEGERSMLSSMTPDSHKPPDCPKLPTIGWAPKDDIITMFKTCYIDSEQCFGDVIASLRRASEEYPTLLCDKRLRRIQRACHQHSPFYEFLLIALQNSVVVTAFSVPLVVKSIAKEMPEELQGRAGWAGLIAMLVTGTSLAQTMMLSSHIISGILVAVVNMYLMQYVLCRPPDNGPDFTCDVPGGTFFTLLFGFVSTFLLLLSSLGPRGQLLALHLNTGNVFLYSRGIADRSKVSFRKHLDILWSSSWWGILIAVVAVLFPKPNFSFVRTRRALVRACAKLAMAHVYAGACFLNPVRRSTKELLKSSLLDLESSLASISSQIGLIWWEGFDLSSLGRSRHLMGRVHALMGKLRDVLRTTALAIDEPILGPRNQQAPEALTFAVQEVIDASVKLLFCLVNFSISVTILPAEENELVRARQRTQEACAKLLPAAQALRAAEASSFSGSLHPDEELFLWSSAQFASLCMDAATDILQTCSQRRADSLTKPLLALVPRNLPKPCCTLSWMRRNRMSIQIAFWNTMAIAIAFYFDYEFPRTHVVLSSTNTLVITDFMTAATAQNVGWLHHKYIGLSLRKTFHRLCGIVVPIILCALIADKEGTCAAEGLLWRAMWFLLFDTIAKFFSFASTEYGYFALLFGAFYSLKGLYPCEDAITPRLMLSMHTSVYNSTAAIVEAVFLLGFLSMFLHFVDLLDGSIDIGTSSPSEDFVSKIGASLSGRVAVTENLFASVKAETTSTPGACLKQLHAMRGDVTDLATLDKLAQEEPRFGNIGWPHGMAGTIPEMIRKLDFCLLTLAHLSQAGVQLSHHAVGSMLFQTISACHDLCIDTFRTYNIREFKDKRFASATALQDADTLQTGIANLIDQARVGCQTISKALLEVQSDEMERGGCLLQDSVACTMVVHQVVMHMAVSMQKLMNGLTVC